MSGRELVVLGTASQVPTRQRAHSGYLLRWDDELLLFDPGEGSQRQLTFANVSPAGISRICITHFHGDHCLGLPGIVQRLNLDRVSHPVDVHFPASGIAYYERLRHAAEFADAVDVRARPARPGAIARTDRFTLTAHRLDHRIDALGYRLAEPDGRRMLPERLAAAGIEGADVGRLQREGVLRTPGGRVSIEDVSAPRRGQVFSFVMDTAMCDGALAAAAGADLLVCEATFLDGESDLAREYGHLTAGQAGRLAAEAGARRLVLSHFSQRYADSAPFAEQAGAHFDDVVVARDLDVIPLPPRRLGVAVEAPPATS